MSLASQQRVARIHPDRPATAAIAVVLTFVVAAAAFAVSFTSLREIGEGMRLGAVSWLVPIMLDGAILSATMLVLVERARGGRGILPWGIIYGATAASAAANLFQHLDRDGWLSSSVAGAAPIILLVLTHAIANVLVVEGGERGPEAETAAAQSEAAAEETVVGWSAHDASDSPAYGSAFRWVTATELATPGMPHAEGSDMRVELDN